MAAKAGSAVVNVSDDAAKAAAKAADDAAKAAAQAAAKAADDALKAADDAAKAAAKKADDAKNAAAKAAADNADDATKLAARNAQKEADEALKTAKELDEIAKNAKSSSQLMDDIAKKVADDAAEESLKSSTKVSSWMARNPGTTFTAAAIIVFGAVVYGLARDMFDKKNNSELTINKLLIVDKDKPTNIQVMFDPGIEVLKDDKVLFRDDTKIFPNNIIDKEIDINSAASRNEINITIPGMSTKTLGTIIINGEELTVIQLAIPNKTNPTTLEITYDQNRKISMNDTIKYKDNSSIEYNVTIDSIISEKVIKVTIPKLESPASLGTLVFKTSMDACLNKASATSTKSIFDNPVTSGIGSVVGGAGSALGSVAGGIFGGLFKMFGPAATWILIAIGLIFGLPIIIFLIKIIIKISQVYRDGVNNYN